MGPAKHRIQIVLFLLAALAVWYVLCGMQTAGDGPEGTFVFRENGKLVRL